MAPLGTGQRTPVRSDVCLHPEASPPHAHSDCVNNQLYVARGCAVWEHWQPSLGSTRSDYSEESLAEIRSDGVQNFDGVSLHPCNSFSGIFTRLRTAVVSRWQSIPIHLTSHGVHLHGTQQGVFRKRIFR